MRKELLRKGITAVTALALCFAMTPAADEMLVFGEDTGSEAGAVQEQSLANQIQEGGAAVSAQQSSGQEGGAAGSAQQDGETVNNAGDQTAPAGNMDPQRDGSGKKGTSLSSSVRNAPDDTGDTTVTGSVTGMESETGTDGENGTDGEAGMTGTDVENETNGKTKPAQPQPKAMPEVLLKTRTTVVIKAVKGIEYSIDGGKTIRKMAGTINRITFQDLTPGTTYTVANRTAGTDTRTASPWTKGTKVTTEKEGQKDGKDQVAHGAKLSYSSIRATRGGSFRLELAGSSKGKALSLSKKEKKVLSIKSAGKNKWTLKLLAPGSATVKIKAGGKKYKCKVTVLPYRIGKHDSLFYAHRGIANDYPENSRVALEKAMKAGFYGTNFDLWPSKPDKKGDFEFIVSHDNKLKDMTSSKGTITGTVASRILKLKVTKGNNAKKYNQKMMKMEDAIAITDKYNGCGQIEMKCNPGKPWSRKQTDELAKRLSKLKHPERYQVESMDPYSLRNFRDSKKKYKRLDSVELNLVCGELTGNAPKLTQVCRKLGFQNMPSYYTKINKDVIRSCRENGIGISAYAHINEDSNLVSKKLEKFDLDWQVMPSIPWFTGK